MRTETVSTLHSTPYRAESQPTRFRNRKSGALIDGDKGAGLDIRGDVSIFPKKGSRSSSILMDDTILPSLARTEVKDIGIVLNCDGRRDKELWPEVHARIAPLVLIGTVDAEDRLPTGALLTQVGRLDSGRVPLGFPGDRRCRTEIVLANSVAVCAVGTFGSALLVIEARSSAETVEDLVVGLSVGHGLGAIRRRRVGGRRAV